MKQQVNEREIFTEFLKSLSIPSTTLVSKINEREFHPILSDISLLKPREKEFNNCYNHKDEIEAIILDGICYITPYGLIKEFILIRMGLYREDFNVPFDNTIYTFKNPKEHLTWQSLVKMRDAALIRI